MGDKVREVFTDAMHAVEVIRYERATFEDFSQAMDDLRDSRPEPNTFIASVKNWMRDVIMAEGFPDPGRNVKQKDCDPWQYDEGEPMEGISLWRGWAYVQKHTEPLTPSYEAAGLYKKALSVEWAVAAGNVSDTFTETLQFGLALSRFMERSRHLTRLTIRKKAEDGLLFRNEGRNVANAKRSAEARQWKRIALELANDYRQRRPEASKAEIATSIVRRWPANSGTICPAKNTLRKVL